MGEKSHTFKLYFIAFQNNKNISCLTANCATTGSRFSTLNIFCIANSTDCFLFFILLCKNLDIGFTKGKKIKANKLRHPTRKTVNQTTTPTLGSNTNM